MDYTSHADPKIKNLGEYLEATKIKADQRKEILNSDFFHSLMKTPGIENKANQNGDAANDNGDIYANFGTAYKGTLMKMTGTKQMSGKNVVIKDNDVSKAARQNVTEASLREMRIQGS